MQQPLIGTALENEPSSQHAKGRLLLSWYASALANWQRIAFWLIISFGTFIRFYRFPQVPAGIWADETTVGYDAYALLLHGTDRWGNPFPVYFPSWGSGQNVLQAYISIPFIQIFGLSVFSVRIAPLLLSILAIPLLYFTVKKLYGTNTALLAAFLFATLPWYLIAARWALESFLLAFFVILSLFALVYSYDSPRYHKWIPLSLIPMALSFYAYGLALIPVACFLLLFVIFNYRKIWEHKLAFVVSVVLFLLISTPFFLFVLQNYVLNKPIHLLESLPITIPFLPSNRLSQVNSGMTPDKLRLANLRFLISGSERNWWLISNDGWIDPLGWVVPPFAFLGIFFSLKRCALSRNVFLFWLLAMLPTGISFVFAVHRTNILFLPLIVLAAYGIVSVLEYVQPIRTQIAVSLVLIGSLCLPSLAFYQYYFGDYNADNASVYNAGYDQALSHAVSKAHPGESIYVHMDGGWINFMNTLFFLRTDPKDFYTRADIRLKYGVYQVSHYDRYYFGPQDPPASLNAEKSYITILKSGYRVSCAHTEVLYRDQTWWRAQWTVARCFPNHHKR